MKALTLFTLALAALLCGCKTSARTKITPGESHEHIVVKHSEPAAVAFSRVELALAESYNDLPAVQKLRQPESGTFILKPLVSYQIGGPIGPIEHARYTLKIVAAPGTVTLDFDLETDIKFGYWPPESEMPKIKSGFRAIAAKVAASVGGSVQ